MEYLAGLFDGEGSISIVRARRKNVSTGVEHMLRATVGMVDREAVEQFQQRWGGHSYASSAHLKHPGKWRPAYVWTVSGPTAERFLREIGPRLHIKRPQAELGVRFQGTLCHQGSRRIPNFALREQLYWRMRELNGTRDRTIGVSPAETERRGDPIS